MKRMIPVWVVVCLVSLVGTAGLQAQSEAAAMKGTDHARMLGAVVGKALQPLASGSGVIEVLVTLQ